MSKEDIENQAVEILKSVQAGRKRPLKGYAVAEAVADFLDIGIVWKSIPKDDVGQIAAMILPIQKEIVINQDIPSLKGGFGQSTIAHEIGHWILHIDRNAVGKFIERIDFNIDDIEIAVEPFLCRSVSTQKGIEWQAQYFAGCLLMPKFKLIEVQKGRNLTKWRHLYAMKDELGVTISNLTNRLQELGWIYIPKNSKQIYPGEA
ncbi:MAG: ImmA/IrrE family metallo-endopeptidase [Nostocaceae cyanobacterium]|nr:ImmA/IrrE family metallo-endopeptidase [Nostocaceae cyanobacterium]